MSTNVSHAYRFAALSIILLNLLDATFTIAYIEAGLAVEANPLMDALLQIGVPLFAAVKLLGVGFAVAFLLLVAERYVTARVGLVCMALAYFALVMYHLSAIPV